ncbi:hypothetical protein, partial [Moorena sp. SIO3I8]|uniref:hypothetical protein n=1 Tax=Moorena sp. SIO3I8 TaxID=2607833 RepID=UPI0025D19387
PINDEPRAYFVWDLIICAQFSPILTTSSQLFLTLSIFCPVLRPVVTLRIRRFAPRQECLKANQRQ